MAIITKRTIMSLYSGLDDLHSHQVRIVMAEKGVGFEVFLAHENNVPKELLQINPYGTMPTLVDRDLVLYEARIILEYLDERFPHPPLLPVYPVARAEARKMLYRIEQDFYSLYKQIILEENNAEAKECLEDSLLNLEPVFADKPFFLSDEFSLLDCVLAPLFWRLPKLGIEISQESKAIHNYMQKVFERNSFQSSLTDTEKRQRVA